MHRRQTIRERAAAVAAGVPATVEEERASRSNEGVRPLVVVHARVEDVAAAEGIMGSPEDRRALELVFDIYTDGASGKEAVDAVNDLDEAIGIGLGVAMLPGGILATEVLDLRWTRTAIELNTSDQDRYLAFGSILYTAVYDVYFGAPT